MLTYSWYMYIWGEQQTWQSLPPSISLASLAASKALPQEFLFTIDIISGAALSSSLSLPT